MKFTLTLLAPFLAAAGPAAADEVVDVVCLTAPKPVIVRVHLGGDAAKAAGRWGEFVSEWFDFLDRDGDGRLSAGELKRAPAPGQLVEQWQAGLYPRLGIAGAELATADQNGDGWVSRAELDRYYRLAGAGPLTPMQNRRLDGRPQALTEVLFTRLDRDGDGKLSRNELAQAFRALRLLDANDDEILTRDELHAAATATTAEQPRSPIPVFILDPQEEMRKPQREVLWKEARKHGSRTIQNELARALDRPPDLEAIVSEHEVTKAQPAPVDDWKRQNRRRLLIAALPGVLVESRCAQPERSVATSIRQFYRQQFKTADRHRRGRVARDDLEASDLALLRGIFDLADRDGDGQLTEAELTRCVDLHAKSLQARVNLLVAADRAGLFELLDANRDGRLTMRELQAAPDGLMQFATNKDFLTRDDLPRRLELVWSLGPPSLSVREDAWSEADPDATPRWFKLMDRNRDGDISPREWLGSLDEFRKFDRNGDGLIGVEEAIENDRQRQPRR